MAVKDLAIYGAGGFGREVALLVEQINAVERRWNLIGFYDDNKVGKVVDGYTVLGGIHDLNNREKPVSVVLAIADSAIRKFLTASLNPMIDFPLLLHPSANTGSPENRFGRGSIVCAGVIFTVGISLGEFVIINLACTIGHDVHVGNHSSVMPGCNISGAVNIGEEVLIGTGARILQGLSIGARSKIGAGAVVTRNVNQGATVKGVPAK